jgi:hypothetical protein
MKKLAYIKTAEQLENMVKDDDDCRSTHSRKSPIHVLETRRSIAVLHDQAHE